MVISTLKTKSQVKKKSNRLGAEREILPEEMAYPKETKHYRGVIIATTLGRALSCANQPFEICVIANVPVVPAPLLANKYFHYP